MIAGTMMKWPEEPVHYKAKNVWKDDEDIWQVRLDAAIKEAKEAGYNIGVKVRKGNSQFMHDGVVIGFNHTTKKGVNNWGQPEELEVQFKGWASSYHYQELTIIP